MSLPTTAARNTVATLLTRMLGLPLSFLSSVLLARMLGDERMGLYRYLLLFNVLWLPIATLGLGGSTIYLLSSRKFTVQSVWPTTLILGLLQGLVILLLAACLAPWNLLGEILTHIPHELFVATLMMLPLQGMYLMGTRILVGDSQFAKNNLLHLGSVVMLIALQFILLVVWPWAVIEQLHLEKHWHLDPLYAAMLAYIVSNLVLAIWLVWRLWSLYRPTRLWNSGFIGESLNYGWKVWWGDITSRLNLRGDQWILSYLVGPGELGQYGQAVTLSEILWHIPDSLNFVLFNKLAAEKNTQARLQLTEQVHRVLFWGMLGLTLLGMLAAPWLVPWLFGIKFEPAVEPLIWLLPGTLFLTTTKVITKYFGAVGRPGLSSLTTIAGTVIGLTTCWCMLWFFPEWGITGVALASSLGYFSSAVLSLVLYRRISNPHRSHFFQPRSQDWLWFRQQFRQVV